MSVEKNKKFSVVTKIIVFLGTIALVFISVAIYKETAKKRQIQNQINQLQQEAEKISRENTLTQDKIAYLESKDYQEREAKDKLNLQSPDENVVVVKPTIAKEEKVEEKVSPMIPLLPEKISCATKWWNYFFKY
jgi:cell division protein FtsB